MLEVVFKSTQMLVPYRLVRMYWIDVATEDTDVGAVYGECFPDRYDELLGVCIGIRGLLEDLLEGQLNGNGASVPSDLDGEFLDGVECAQVMGSESYLFHGSNCRCYNRKSKGMRGKRDERVHVEKLRCRRRWPE